MTTIKAAPSGSLAETVEAVERMLDRLLPKPVGEEAPVLSAMRYATLNGGKRLRPHLVLSSAKLFGVSRACATRVAAAIECIHCYSLVHDDLPAMDDDSLRRGMPTAHIKYDEATAILAGDGLLTIAFEILSDHETHEDPSVRIGLIAALAKAAGAEGMVGGQMMDLVAETRTYELGQITRLQRLKTGALIAFACESGAILGRADKTRRLALTQYAHDLGLAFQIVDDLLDVEGTEEEMGKRVGKDADLNKATFVSILGVARAREQAHMLADQAVKHLDIFDDRADDLREVARFVVERRG